MPNTQSQFNPAYSTIKSIFVGGLEITKQNTECRFEKIEIVENITEVLPRGTVVVTDLKDIVSYVNYNAIDKVVIEFFGGNKWDCDVTSVSYVNNAASDSDDTIVAINFTNHYYKYFSTNSLNSLLEFKKPKVFHVNELVAQLRFTFGANSGWNDTASNYFLYKPLSPYNSGEESVPDNAIELFNYLSTGAVDEFGEPNFIFWTGMAGDVNFKSFKRNILQDASYASMDSEVRNVGLFKGDAVIQKLSDKKRYRKAYFLASNPAYQWISKNYYYIRKTPKYLDSIAEITIPEGLSEEEQETAKVDAAISTQNTALKNLTFQFQDDGQKYNIDVVTVSGRGTDAPKGGDQIIPENVWGYYDGQVSGNGKSISNTISNQYGVGNNYKSLSLMGLDGFMPFLDSPDMWKNMFDVTPIHPNYPDNDDVAGDATNLQKVMDIRYDVFSGGASGASGASAAADRLEEIRKIEAQNFVMYSLCCMGKKEDCFFAVLQRYEPDNTYYGVNCAQDPIFPASAKLYRYKWTKILFEPGHEGVECGTCGSSGASGGAGGAGGSGVPTSQGGQGSNISGCTTYSHQLEKWCLDPSTKSSPTQDDTWAINLNERGLSGAYLPPGWVSPTSASFKFRPIGIDTSSVIGVTGGDIKHIARVCIEQIDAKTRVTSFWIENVVDGNC
jgi:hypothetical protein